MPPETRDAWLWRNSALSDVTLLIYPAGDGPDGAWTAGKPEPLARLPLHASVLASVSPEHYRGHLLRLWQDRGPGADEQPAAKRAKVADSSTPGNVLELTCFPGEPEAVPEAVMHHAYTGILPADAALLAWMVWRADYLDMHATVEACLAKLSTMADGDKLAVQDLVVISSLPALQTGSRAAAEQQVAQMAGKVLAAQLGVAWRVLVEQQLLQQFVQLPFQLLKQWASLTTVEIDSENTMAVLITAWHHHQLSSTPPAPAPTEQQCKELSALICLDKLSPSFHMQVMPHLEWYRTPGLLPDQHAAVRVLAGLITAGNRGFKAALASGGVARRLQPTMSMTWNLSRQQLQQLWADDHLLLGTAYFAGFVFAAQLDLEQSNSRDTAGQRTLRLYLWIQWDKVLMRHVGGVVPDPVTAVHVAFQVGGGEAAGDLILSRTLLRCLERPRQRFSRVEDLVSFMGPDNKVKVTLSNAR